MAEKIAQITPPRVGSPRKYPWDEWADGSAWRVTRGQDYDIPSKSMASMVRSHAASIGATASAVIVGGGEAVEFRFILPTDEADPVSEAA